MRRSRDQAREHAAYWARPQSEDRFHPAEAGHRIWADAIWEQLRAAGAPPGGPGRGRAAP